MRLQNPTNYSHYARMDTSYWHRYYAADDSARATGLMRSHTLRSTGVDLHIDVYPQPRRDAPLLVFNHGGGGYAKLFVLLALAFHERGYTVVMADQKGQGDSGGDFGDFTIAEATQNIVDVARWARREFGGTLFLGGASIGGGLTYAAAASMAQAGDPPSAVLCHNLYDFGDPRTGLEFTRFALLARIPLLPCAMAWSTRRLAALFPRLRMPYRPLANFRAMLDERDLAGGFYEQWSADPHSLRTVTARYFSSVMGTPAAIAMADNRVVPVLVVNPRRDRMVRPAVTRECYERLGGPKRYAELDYGHYSLQPEFTRRLVELADGWFRNPAAEGTSSGPSSP